MQNTPPEYAVAMHVSSRCQRRNEVGRRGWRSRLGRGEPSSYDSSPEPEEEIMSEEDDPQADMYVIPMRRPPDERIGNNRGAPGLQRQLPRRQRRAPQRFQAGKLHTFAVPASNVVFL